MKSITRDDLKAKIDACHNLTIVAALGQESFDQAHIPGAIRMTAEEAVESVARRIRDKNAEIVVYCSDRTRDASQHLAKELEAHEYRNVAHFAGGLAEWIDAGYPTVSGSASRQSTAA